MDGVIFEAWVSEGSLGYGQGDYSGRGYEGVDNSCCGRGNYNETLLDLDEEDSPVGHGRGSEYSYGCGEGKGYGSGSSCSHTDIGLLYRFSSDSITNDSAPSASLSACTIGDDIYCCGAGSCDSSGFGCGFVDSYGRSGNEYRDVYYFNNLLISYNGQKVFYIDHIPYIPRHIKKEIAFVDVICEDMRTKKKVIVKGQGMFACGNTIKEAFEALENKRFDRLDIESKKQKFFLVFNTEDEYPARDFFVWHGFLTGSCESGRMIFAKEKGFDLDHDKMTKEEFFMLVKDEYGWEIIKTLLA